MHGRSALALVGWFAAATTAWAEDWRGVPLFEIPAAAAALSAAVDHADAGDRARAALEALTLRYRGAGRPQAERARLAAAEGDSEAAAAALIAAAERGYDGAPALLSRPPLSALASRPDLKALREAPPPAAPAPPPPMRIDTGAALVSEANTAWDEKTQSLVARFEALAAMRRFPVVEVRAAPPLPELQAWVLRGKAAGNVGDLYDNRDRGHSRLMPRDRLQMSVVTYAPAAQAAGLDYGLNTQILFDAPTIGNASTAVQGPFWRSQPRLALTSPGGAERLWRLHQANHLYVFPEHRDHDPETPPEDTTGGGARPGHGDLIPANTPYHLISQGSSGSDQPILLALRTILAAFRPETKAFLTAHGLIAPAMQQVFRRGQAGIGDAGYLTAAAHPAVFDPARTDLAAMMRLANAMRPEAVPPLVRLTMVSESGAAGGAAGLGGAAPGEERLFDTPGAIARAWRGAGFERRYILSAAATEDPNGRPLRFRWILTQGRQEAVEIRLLDDSGMQAEIVILWDSPAPTALRPDILSPRVDVAVIADNGAERSAPAFFSVLRHPYEARRYEHALSGPRLVAIEHGAGPRRRYADPLIWPERRWEDRLNWAPSGRLEGWARRRGAQETRFTAHGLLVREEDALGRASVAEAVRYDLEPRQNRPPVVAETPTGRRFAYVYADDDDQIGAPAPID